jgi:hypothetical protein
VRPVPPCWRCLLVLGASHRPWCMPCGHHSYEPFLRDAVMSYIKQVNPQFYHATTAGSLTENGAKQFWLSIYDLPQVEKCGASLSLSLSLTLSRSALCSHAAGANARQVAGTENSSGRQTADYIGHSHTHIRGAARAD